MFDRWKNYEVNSIYTDFRDDVIAAGVVENGFDIDRILILRGDSASRQTDKEIESIEYNPNYKGKGNDSGTLIIRTNRYGIYDNLPEGVFYPANGLNKNSKEAIIKSIRRQNKEEFLIRRFFSLFEVEVERNRIQIRQSELRYDRPCIHRNFVDTMLPFWPAIKIMDIKTAILFVGTVPYLSEIRNSYTRIARALSTIMGYRISIKTTTRESKQRIKHPRLGLMRLGMNAVLKSNAVETVAIVELQPDRESLRELLPGMSKYIIAETLLDIFMPQRIAWELRIVPTAEDHTARPGNKNHPCILGVNARLSPSRTSTMREDQKLLIQ